MISRPFAFLDTFFRESLLYGNTSKPLVFIEVLPG